jgi:tetratricopeptide (TPR) repeat protein
MFCRTCWANLPDGTKLCPRCGSDPRFPVTRPIEQSSPTLKPGRPKSYFPSVLSSLVILSLIAGAVFYLYTHRPSENEVTFSELTVLEGEEKPLPIVLTELSSPGPPETENIEVYEGVTTTVNEAVRAFNEGNWQEAARLFRSALEDSPESALLKTYLAQSLARMAWQEYEEGNYNGAGELFYEAIGVERDPNFFKGLAYARAAENELEAAAEALENVKGEPEADGLLKGIYARLGEDHYRRGSLEEAIVYFERGLALDPGDKHLRAALERLHKEHDLEAGFRQKEGSHFVVSFEGGENAVAGHLIGLLLEEAYLKVGADLGYYPEEMIGAVLYSGEQFRDTIRSPSWVGAIYDGRIKIPAGGVTERTEVLEKVIFHEYTHAVVHRLSKGRAPVWLNEGISQYEEGKRAAPYAGLLKDIVGNKRVSLSAMEGSFMGLGKQEAEAGYLLSLSATQFIIDDFGTYAVKRILEELGEGLSLDEAISSAIYLSYELLEESWLDTLR